MHNHPRLTCFFLLFVHCSLAHCICREERDIHRRHSHKWHTNWDFSLLDCVIHTSQSGSSCLCLEMCYSTLCHVILTLYFMILYTMQCYCILDECTCIRRLAKAIYTYISTSGTYQLLGYQLTSNSQLTSMASWWNKGLLGCRIVILRLVGGAVVHEPQDCWFH